MIMLDAARVSSAIRNIDLEGRVKLKCYSLPSEYLSTISVFHFYAFLVYSLFNAFLVYPLHNSRQPKLHRINDQCSLHLSFLLMSPPAFNGFVDVLPVLSVSGSAMFLKIQTHMAWALELVKL